MAALVGVVIALEMAAVLLPRLPPDRRAGTAGAAALQARQHQAARHRGLHALPLSAADRRGAAAGGDHRRHRADAAPPQGLASTSTRREQVSAQKADRVRIVQMKPRSTPASDAARADAAEPTPAKPAARSAMSSRPRHPRPLPVARRDPVRAVGDRHLPEPQEPDRAADGDRADAARGQPELRRLLALPRRHGRPGVRVLHPDRGRRRVGDRPGDPGRAVPQPRRRSTSTSSTR